MLKPEDLHRHIAQSQVQSANAKRWLDPSVSVKLLIEEMAQGQYKDWAMAVVTYRLQRQLMADEAANQATALREETRATTAARWHAWIALGVGLASILLALYTATRPQQAVVVSTPAAVSGAKP